MSDAKQPHWSDRQYIAVCMGCGEPLSKNQKSLRVYDKGAIDFDEREPIEVLLIFCSDCKEQIKKRIAGGIRAAVEVKTEKMKRLSAQDAIEHAARGVERDKNDGALPV